MQLCLSQLRQRHLGLVDRLLLVVLFLILLGFLGRLLGRLEGKLVGLREGKRGSEETDDQKEMAHSHARRPKGGKRRESATDIAGKLILERIAPSCQRKKQKGEARAASKPHCADESPPFA